jgi:hypothetical protein
MKKMTMAGGLTGFALGLLCGLLTEGSSWPGILLRASVAAVAAALLLRWWLRVFAGCLAEARAQRRAASAAKEVGPLSSFTRNVL